MAALSQLQTDLALKLADSNNRILSAAEMTALENQAQNEWVNRVEEIRQENAYNVVSKQYDYAAPSDIIKVIAGIWMPTRTRLEVIGNTEGVFEGAYSWLGRGVPSSLMIDGKNGAYRYRLFPAPSSTSAATTINQGGGISNSVTTIPVASTATFRSPSGWVLIESEKILYQDTTATSLLLCRRAMGGTTAATHADTTAVTQLDFHTIYSRQPAPLSASTDIPEIDARWHYYLNWWCLATALKLDGRAGESQLAERKWEQSIREAKRAVKRVQAATPFCILMGWY